MHHPPIQVEQLLDDGSHPAIPQRLFDAGPLAAPAPRTYSCPCCSRIGDASGLCAVCDAAGWSAPALGLDDHQDVTP